MSLKISAEFSLKYTDWLASQLPFVADSAVSIGIAMECSAVVITIKSEQESSPSFVVSSRNRQPKCHQIPMELPLLDERRYGLRIVRRSIGCHSSKVSGIREN
jgi:hypothetical protein